MNLKKLLEQINEYEEFQALRLEEAKRFEERLEILQKARNEAFDLVASNNANDVAHLKLDEDDVKIAALKKTAQAYQHKTQSLLHSMRTKILQIQEKANETLQADLEKNHETQLRLKKNLIPKAEARLTSLLEKEIRVKDSLKRIRKESRKVSRLNLDHLT